MAPAVNVVNGVTVPWAGIPEVISDNGGMELPSMVDVLGGWEEVTAVEAPEVTVDAPDVVIVGTPD